MTKQIHKWQPYTTYGICSQNAQYTAPICCEYISHPSGILSLLCDLAKHTDALTGSLEAGQEHAYIHNTVSHSIPHLCALDAAKGGTQTDVIIP